MDALSKAELHALLAIAREHSERDWLMFLVAYLHGLRVSEVVGLTRDNVGDGMLDVRRLKGSRRTVQPLVEHSNPLLNERQALIDLAASKHPNQTLFKVGARQAERLFARYAAAAGIARHQRHPHVLKHTCGLQVFERAGINKTQTWLGHKSGASTLMYTRVSDAEAAPAVLAALRD